MPTKTIILVRHGQYQPASEKNQEHLTSLGRQQAKFVANRLKENKIDRIVHSTMPRAIETADIIKKLLKFKRPFLSCDSLRECVPGFPKNLQKKFGYTDNKKLKTHKAQADKAFAKYFKPSKKDTTEVLVCHGNIIRYLVCRVLEIDTLKWRQMDILQCAITVIEVKNKGTQRKLLLSHNDVGHIPKSKRTFL